MMAEMEEISKPNLKMSEFEVYVASALGWICVEERKGGGEEIGEDNIQHPTHCRNRSEEINITNLRHMDRHVVFSLP